MGYSIVNITLVAEETFIDRLFNEVRLMDEYLKVVYTTFDGQAPQIEPLNLVGMPPAFPDRLAVGPNLNLISSSFYVGDQSLMYRMSNLVLRNWFGKKLLVKNWNEWWIVIGIIIQKKLNINTSIIYL